MNEFHISVLLILGIGIFGGTLGAAFFQKLRIPQVLGYITIGILVGRMGFNIIEPQDIEKLAAFNWFALGIIGFLVGGELRGESFKKFGKKFILLALGEGLGAFVLVSIPVTLIVYAVSHNFSVSLAAGVVFGAISSATDPASTVDVLWEDRAKGALTTALIAVVALDDALAMTLYGLGTSAAAILTGNDGVSVLHEMTFVTVHLLASVLLGVVAGILLTLILTRFNQSIERLIAITVGIILLAVGIADFINLDIILTAMAVGTTLVNLAPRKSEKLYQSVKSFSVPVYAMFFVLVGAGLSIGNMPYWLWLIVAAYAVFRSIGKMTGAYLSAKITNCEPVIQKYTGLGLFAQGGVAIGLSIVASTHLTGIDIAGMSLGSMIITGVTATTLIVQLAGPPMVKLAVKLARENNRNVTESDIINEMTVADVMDTDVTAVNDTEPVENIIKLFTTRPYPSYPVVDSSGKLIGVISLDNIKGVLLENQCWNWLLAQDVLVPVEYKVFAHLPLKSALHILQSSGLAQIPVLDSADSEKPIGVMDIQRTRSIIQGRLISAQSSA